LPFRRHSYCGQPRAQRFGVTPQVAKHDAPIVMGFGQVGLERDRALEALQRLRGASRVSERDAAIVVDCRVIGLEGDRALVALQRVGVAPQIAEHNAAVVIGLRPSGTASPPQATRLAGTQQRHVAWAALR